MPQPGPDEIVVKNRAIAVNTVDWHMQDIGIFVQQWPTILGSDVAGEVHEIGAEVTRFKRGDRVVGSVLQYLLIVKAAANEELDMPST